MWCPNRGFWTKTSLAELGVVLYLGHEGECCTTTPKLLDGSPDVKSRARDMVVVHEHGIMKIPALFCQCPTRQVSEPVQLLQIGLWPATWKHPRTAITLSALEMYHSLSARAMVNVNDYMEHLKHLTDAVLTQDVPVCTQSCSLELCIYNILRIAIASSTMPCASSRSSAAVGGWVRSRDGTSLHVASQLYVLRALNQA